MLIAISHFLSCKSTTKNRQFLERANQKKDEIDEGRGYIAFLRLSSLVFVGPRDRR